MTMAIEDSKLVWNFTIKNFSEILILICDETRKNQLNELWLLAN